MMLGSVLGRSVRDRWSGAATGAVVIGLFLLGAMAAYQQVDTSLYTDMPEAMRAAMGIPADADPTSLAYNVVLGLVGALTLAGIGVSLGASTIAGEERDGTMAVLLGTPRSRRRVLVERTGAMLLLVTAGSLLVLGASHLAPVLLDVELGGTAVTATVVHLWANAVLFGMLAAAIGAVTGNRTLASAATAGGMVVAYFLTGLLPLAESVADVAKVLPWYWFDGHDPLVNGLAGGYLALQLGTVAVLAAVAWWGVEARDLRRRAGATSPVTALLDRARQDERAAALLDRLGGTVVVRSVWSRASSDGQALVAIVAIVMFAMMGLLMGPMYAALEGTLAEVSGSLPETLLAVVGGGDMSTPEGWYRLETFGLMAPIAVTLVAATVGARALAGEEQDRAMGLLLSTPISRRRVVLEKAVALTVHTSIVGVATFLGVAGGSLLGGLGMSIGNIAATSLQLTLLGLLFGAVALAVGAGTGSVRTATVATIGAVGTAYVANSLLTIAEDLRGWAVLSPFEWYLGGQPLLEGLEWRSVGLFAASITLLVTLSVVLFDRRDLRRG